jgi:hypothetical protein
MHPYFHKLSARARRDWLVVKLVSIYEVLWAALDFGERSNATNSLKSCCSFTEALAIAFDHVELDVESLLRRKRSHFSAVRCLRFSVAVEHTDDAIHAWSIVQRQGGV